jgi:hypothetical protein
VEAAAMTAADFKDYVLAVCSMVTTCAVVIGAIYARKLEKNTNSIKDALVAETKKGAHAEGVLDGKAAEKANPS